MICETKFQPTLTTYISRRQINFIIFFLFYIKWTFWLNHFFAKQPSCDSFFDNETPYYSYVFYINLLYTLKATLLYTFLEVFAICMYGCYMHWWVLGYYTLNKPFMQKLVYRLNSTCIPLWLLSMHVVGTYNSVENLTSLVAYKILAMWHINGYLKHCRGIQTRLILCVRRYITLQRSV